MTTYVSHAVRSLAAHAAPGDTVGLVVTPADDAAVDDVAGAVERVGGEVVRELEFDRLLVEIEATKAAAVPGIAGVAAVETDAVIEHP